MDFVKLDAAAADDCPPEVSAFLRGTGLPRKVITIFEAAPAAGKRCALLGGREIAGITLGHSREQDEIFLDFESGRVWLLASWRPDQPILVNSSLRAFVDSLMLAAARYPFYPPDRDLDDAERAEGALRDALEEIDESSTGDPDGFWSAFLDDVANGDYAGQ